MARRCAARLPRTAPTGMGVPARGLRRLFTPLVAGLLFLAFFCPAPGGNPLSPGAAARGTDPEGAMSAHSLSPADVYELSGAVAEKLTRFAAHWRMTMTPWSSDDLEPVVTVVTDMYLWRDGGSFRHEARMPQELLDAPPTTLMTDGTPACAASVVREGEGVFYCQLLDGGWQIHELDGVDFVSDIPFLLTGSPEDAGLELTDLLEDEWAGRPAWRLVGNLDAAMDQVSLPFELKTSVSMWIDRQSLLLMASESRMELSPETLGGALRGFVILMELIEFDAEADIPAELFARPPGL